MSARITERVLLKVLQINMPHEAVHDDNTIDAASAGNIEKGQLVTMQT